MKNMTLPAKSSNESYRSKTGLTVKRSYRLLAAGLLALAVSALALSGCKDKNAPESFNGNVSRPTWTAPEVSDLTSSMTAVVKVDLKAQCPETAADWTRSDDDLLAAFSGETCLGVAEWVSDAEAYWLYIAAPLTNDKSQMTNQAVTLRYYSAHYKNLFEAKDAFEYHNDTQQGTADNPLIPTFVVVK